MKAILALADGTVFEGEQFGATGETVGEVVFNTSMTGVSGSFDRSVLQRADRDNDISTDRQLRLQRS